MRKQLIGVLTLVALFFLWVPTARMAASDYSTTVTISKSFVSVSVVNAKFQLGDTVSMDLYDGYDTWLLNRTTSVRVKGIATFNRLDFAALSLPDGVYKIRVAKGVEWTDDYADTKFTVGAAPSPTPTPISATGIQITSQLARYKVNQVVSLQYKALPAGATIQDVHWFSSNETVATIDPYSGELTALAPGTTYITVTNDEGTLVDVKSIVVYVPVTSVSLNKSKVTIQRKKSTTLILKANPSRATLPRMIWSSSDSKGKLVKWTRIGTGAIKVTGVSVGTVTLTAKSTDGKFKATCKITVKK